MHLSLEGEARQVTLWRKPRGFGVHLSGGLPPIVVTYVEPGIHTAVWYGVMSVSLQLYTRATKPSYVSSLPSPLHIHFQTPWGRVCSAYIAMVTGCSMAEDQGQTGRHGLQSIQCKSKSQSGWSMLDVAFPFTTFPFTTFPSSLLSPNHHPHTHTG